MYCGATKPKELEEMRKAQREAMELASQQVDDSISKSLSTESKEQ